MIAVVCMSFTLLVFLWLLWWACHDERRDVIGRDGLNFYQRRRLQCRAARCNTRTTKLHLEARLEAIGCGALFVLYALFDWRESSWRGID